MWSETLPKAQRTRGLSSSNQSNILRSYHEFKHKSWSNFIFRISTEHQLQNLNKTSASRLNLKFKILSRISTKIQLHNLYKTSATKYRPNSSFKFCLNFKTLPKAQRTRGLSSSCQSNFLRSYHKSWSHFYRTRVRSLAMLVTNSLTDWLTDWLLFSGLDGCEWYQLLDDVAIATESCEKLS